MQRSSSASLSLDLLRAAAASLVVVYHTAWLGLDGGALQFVTPPFGHAAVVVFFVLSGFVIAATTRPDESPIEYAIKRLARVYSVALPALLLVMALGYVSLSLGEMPANAYQLQQPLLYFAFHSLFAGDLWGLGISAFSIGPYWSLNYEVWYYIIFGVATFTSGTSRVLAVGLVLLLMGPKMLLLLPIWLTGAGLYAVSRTRPLPRGLARAVAATALALLVAFTGSAWEMAIATAGNASIEPYLPSPLRFSQWFLADYVKCILTTAMIWGLCSADIPWPRWLARAGTWLANVSFSLYLMHFPLMLFFRAALPDRGPLAALLAVACSLAFGMVFEPQRNRLRKALQHAARPLVARTS